MGEGGGEVGTGRGCGVGAVFIVAPALFLLEQRWRRGKKNMKTKLEQVHASVGNRDYHGLGGRGGGVTQVPARPCSNVHGNNNHNDNNNNNNNSSWLEPASLRRSAAAPDACSPAQLGARLPRTCRDMR